MSNNLRIAIPPVVPGYVNPIVLGAPKLPIVNANTKALGIMPTLGGYKINAVTTNLRGVSIGSPHVVTAAKSSKSNRRVRQQSNQRIAEASAITKTNPIRRTKTSKASKVRVLVNNIKRKVGLKRRLPKRVNGKFVKGG